MILKNSRPYFYLFNAIKWRLLLILVVIIITAFVGDILDRTTDIEHPISIPAFFGTAIAFVLGFRTNQAYERWWEARKIWGSIVNDSRSWTRMVLTLINFTKDDPRKELLIKRQVAWNYILARRLREQDPLADVSNLIIDHEREHLKNSVNANQLLLAWQSRDIAVLHEEGYINDFHHIELEECLKTFEASMGKAERIKNTHFPVLYDHLVHLSIYLFASLLTFSIVDSSHVFEVIFTTVVSALFLAIEFIGKEMQDPFEDTPSDTPMSSLSNTIKRGAFQLMGLEDDIEIETKKSFYVK